MSNGRKKALNKGRTGSEATGSIKSLSKGLRVLEAFKGSERDLSLGHLAMITGLDKSSVQRCTRTLRELGYLEQDAETRRYRIGRRVLDLSYEYLRSNLLVERSSPVLLELRQTARERVDLSIVDDTHLIYVMRLQSKRDPFPAALVGRRVPIYCTAGGRAILSKLPEPEAMEVLARSKLEQRTQQTLINVEAIMAEVRRAKSKGYATQVEEWRPGEVVVAAPVVDRQGLPVGAIHIAGSTNEWLADEFERRMGPLVASAASDLSRS